MESLRYLATELQDTRALAETLAPQLRADDVILLNGPLGSGKTTFVQQIARALGYQDPVTSPTFTIANFYECPSLTVLHIDAYRLETLAEFRDLGLTDFGEECCTLIEWGALVADEFIDSLVVEISFTSHGETEREFKITAETERWESALREMRSGHLRLVGQ